MAQINYIKERLLRLSNQSTNAEIQEYLTELPSSLIEMAEGSQAAVIAETILWKLKRYSYCYRSENKHM